MADVLIRPAKIGQWVTALRSVSVPRRCDQVGLHIDDVRKIFANTEAERHSAPAPVGHDG